MNTVFSIGSFAMAAATMVVAAGVYNTQHTVYPPVSAAAIFAILSVGAGGWFHNGVVYAIRSCRGK